MDLQSALKKTKIAQHEYNFILPQGAPISMDMGWLVEAIEKYTEHTIKFKGVDWTVVQIKGRIDRYEDPATGAKSADIVYSTSSNDCWKRFVCVKEMCHLIIDSNDSSITSNGVAGANDQAHLLIHKILQMRSGRPLTADEVTPQWWSEEIAVHCAIELMFPVKYRLLAAQRFKTEDPHLVIMSVAHEYKLPAHYVEQSLDATYLEFIGGLAQLVEKEITG